MNIVERLTQFKVEGLDAYQAVQVLKKELKRPLPPTRYEVGGDIYGVGRIVALLEVNGEQADRVALTQGQIRELAQLLGVEIVDFEEFERLANTLPLEGRPPVPFYPFTEEEAFEIIRAISSMVHTDMEDFRGNPLASVIGIAWKIA
jgi:hypothetical protein